MIKIFLGSRNRAKYLYYGKYCQSLECQFVTPHDISTAPDFEENGKTIKENAEIKALNWSKHTPYIVLAEDCGFDIPALPGWEKLSPKRNVGEHLSDDQKRRNLLEIMKHLTGEDRRIIWTTGIALAKDGKLIGSISFENPHPSYISEKIDETKPVIEGQFLSPIEYKPEFNKVYSELDEEEVERNEKEMFDIFRKFVKEMVDGIQEIK